MEYSHLNPALFSITLFDEVDIIDKIKNKSMTDDVMVNILIKYFNNEEVTFEDLHSLKNIDYVSTKELFYLIPITIYCLENIIVNILT